MVIALEPEIEIKEQYEPTVSDKIQKILYRLDQGEELSRHYLKNYDTGKYCVLGLFADESGLGHWRDDAAYVTDHADNHKILGMDIVDHYNLTSEAGMFRVKDLPEDLQSELFGSVTNDPTVYCSLSRINDCGFVIPSDLNRVLAAVIRSGAVFRKES